MNEDTDALRLRLDPTGVLNSWSLVGELDSHSAGLVAETVAGALPPAEGASVTLVMSDVSFIDSSGLRALVDLRTTLVGAGGSLAIVDPSDAVRRVVELTGLSDHLGIE